ncbi:uncharacterized protein M6B38_369355 [Iris pallida]|uniref:Uncharacterized protein n=1 Tax=Iris pallida TaxID=29817 RepID=A0AAX6GEW6_IRIPA|nr:uncharacterized protein M6B38_369355 [Iris pallida]
MAEAGSTERKSGVALVRAARLEAHGISLPACGQPLGRGDGEDRVRGGKCQEQHEEELVADYQMALRSRCHHHGSTQKEPSVVTPLLDGSTTWGRSYEGGTSRGDLDIGGGRGLGWPGVGSCMLEAVLLVVSTDVAGRWGSGLVMVVVRQLSSSRYPSVWCSTRACDGTRSHKRWNGDGLGGEGGACGCGDDGEALLIQGDRCVVLAQWQRRGEWRSCLGV